MSNLRSKLAIGSQLDGIYTIVEYLEHEDTDSSVVYKVRDLFSKSEDMTELFSNTFSPLDISKIDDELAESSHYFIITEYYPRNGCVRKKDSSLIYDNVVSNKEQFDKGRAHFFRDYLDMCKPEYERQFGKPVDYIMLNNTAYCLFDYDQYDYRKKLHLIHNITAPDELIPPYKPLPDINYTVKNNTLNITGIDFSREPYSYLLKDIMGTFTGHLNKAVSEEQSSLQNMINLLSEFESNDRDESLGEKEVQISREDMDNELGASEVDWRLLRNLTRDGDEFWRWVVLGECWGVSMVRNGRTFKTWVTAIT